MSLRSLNDELAACLNLNVRAAPTNPVAGVAHEGAVDAKYQNLPTLD